MIAPQLPKRQLSPAEQVEQAERRKEARVAGVARETAKAAAKVAAALHDKAKQLVLQTRSEDDDGFEEAVAAQLSSLLQEHDEKVEAARQTAKANLNRRQKIHRFAVKAARTKRQPLVAPAPPVAGPSCLAVDPALPVEDSPCAAATSMTELQQDTVTAPLDERCSCGYFHLDKDEHKCKVLCEAIAKARAKVEEKKKSDQAFLAAPSVSRYPFSDAAAATATATAAAAYLPGSAPLNTQAAAAARAAGIAAATAAGIELPWSAPSAADAAIDPIETMRRRQKLAPYFAEPTPITPITPITPVAPGAPLCKTKCRLPLASLTSPMPPLSFD
jgi:hypothetical protein